MQCIAARDGAAEFVCSLSSVGSSHGRAILGAGWDGAPFVIARIPGLSEEPLVRIAIDMGVKISNL